MDIIHHHFESLISTNDWGKQKIHTFPPHALTLVTADYQERGRGQYGRRWISPKGDNLYASFCFFIDRDREEPLYFTYLLATSIIDCLKSFRLSCTLKWPNDLLVADKKIGGILCETKECSTKIGMIIGLGLNVNMSEEMFSKINQPATSLKCETKKVWKISRVLKKILLSFHKALNSSK
ncbi:MAG: biotin--[acetyl-CoA-carboxylase] ligase [Chlamydiales bacterium]